MNTAAAHYLEQCRALHGALPGRHADWLQSQRRAALARFEEVGFPSQRDEDWRYTATRPITAKRFHAAERAADTVITPAQLDALRIEGLSSHRLVFIDGLFAAELSDTAEDNNVTVHSLAQVLDEHPEQVEHALGKIAPRKQHGFTALNNACIRDGAAVLLPPGTVVAQPLELLFISATADGFAQPRNLVIAGADSQVAIIERHLSFGEHAAFTNSASEIMLGERAAVDYYLVQTQSPATHHICGIWAKQARASRFSCRSVTLGGALVRNDLGVELAGEEAHCDMLGLYNLSGRQHVDNHTTVTHAAENCSSHELYKGVLDGRSRAVFHGRIVVAAGAQKTNAAQTNNNLLLSRGAEIDSKPQLEIYADDVKCSHGATVGQLDPDALFYLRSRGLGEVEARQMLTFAFVNDVVGEIGIEALRETLASTLARRLTAGETAGEPTGTPP